MFRIERMNASDFHFAVQLASTMNWNTTENDFAFMKKLEPNGCFVMLYGSKRIGIATNISLGKVGWFGHFIIKENYRHKGAGTLLVKHSIDYLNSKNVETVGLYSYPHLVGLYEKLGFKHDSEFIVLKGKGNSPIRTENLRRVTKEDVPSLVDFDNRYLFFSRRKLLEAILLNPANIAYVSSLDNEIKGYVAAKVFDETAEVGPLVCLPANSGVAIALLRKVLGELEGFEISICLPKTEEELLTVLFKCGFEESHRAVKMFLGQSLPKMCICVAESLERG